YAHKLWCGIFHRSVTGNSAPERAGSTDRSTYRRLGRRTVRPGHWRALGGGEFRHKARIRNESSQDVLIERFDVGCRSCFHVEPNSLSVRAGQIETVELVFDLTQRSLRDFGSAARPLLNHFSPVLSGNRPATTRSQDAWIVRGTIKSRVTVDAPALDFGESL